MLSVAAGCDVVCCAAVSRVDTTDTVGSCGLWSTFTWWWQFIREPVRVEWDGSSQASPTSHRLCGAVQQRSVSVEQTHWECCQLGRRSSQPGLCKSRLCSVFASCSTYDYLDLLPLSKIWLVTKWSDIYLFIYLLFARNNQCDNHM